MRAALVLLFLASDLCLLTSSAHAEQAPDVVLVKFKRGSDRVRTHAAKRGVRSVEPMAMPDWEVVKLSSGTSVEDALRDYGADPAVAAVQPNYRYRAIAVTPNDPAYGSQYGLAKISAGAAWEFEQGLSQTVTVAVLDTGVDVTHPDLAAKIDTANMAVRCPTSGCGSCTTCTGSGCTLAIADSGPHGTLVAGVAAAATDNSQGISGVSWGARILPVKIFDSGACADSVSLSAGINYVTSVALGQPGTVGKMVMNLSVGECPSPVNSPPSCDSGSDVVKTAVDNALANDIVVVAGGIL